MRRIFVFFLAFFLGTHIATAVAPTEVEYQIPEWLTAWHNNPDSTCSEAITIIRNANPGRNYSTKTCVGLPLVPLFEFQYFGAQDNRNYVSKSPLIYRASNCPANSELIGSTCQCKRGFSESADQTACEPPEPNLDSCQRPDGSFLGNPILPATGEKYRFEVDWSDSGPDPLTFSRIYRSSWSGEPARKTAPLGEVWSHNFDLNLAAYPSTSPNRIVVTTKEGYSRTFYKTTNTANWSTTQSGDTLIQTPTGNWQYYQADRDATFVFDSFGKVLTEVKRNGWMTSYGHGSAGQLTSVTNAFGRTLTFGYGSTGRLATVTTPEGRTLSYGYDSAGRLLFVLYPDGYKREFAYEINGYPQALTGIVDENGSRWGTFEYDAAGRAVRTQLAGAVSRYEVTYPSRSSATVTDPLGTARTYTYGISRRKLAVLGGTFPSADSKNDAFGRVQNSFGLIDSETDFLGTRTIYAWDTTRGLPTSVTQAAGKPEGRTTSTTWHPQWACPSRSPSPAAPPPTPTTAQATA